MPFSIDDIDDLIGKHIIITGASDGVGLATTHHLVNKGAHVIMACRNLSKAQPLADTINAQSVGGSASVLWLDTTDLESIDAFVPALASLAVEKLHALVLNAGIMMVKYAEIATRSEQYPWIESQMATNVVGHFYLIHVLMPLLRVSDGVRVITVSSVAAAQTSRTNSINYEVFLGRKPSEYSEVASYCESKLACQLLAHELERRFAASEMDAIALSSHPGYSRTKLQEKVINKMARFFAMSIRNILSMSAKGGGLVLAVAAGVPIERIPEKAYFTPNGLMAYVGAPTSNGKMEKQGRDDEQSLLLWHVCEQICGIRSEI